MAKIGRNAACASLLAVLAPWATAHAAGVSASVDRTEASLQEQLLLTVTVSGSQSAEPSLPMLPMFDVHARGTSRQMSITNGHLSTTVSYQFGLVPKRPGHFTIGPVSAHIDDRTYQSEPFAVQITSAPTTAQQSDAPLFVSAEVSTQTPYVGQQIVYTWRFYRRARVASANVTPFEFGNLAVESLGERREFETTLHGQQYAVTEIRKALFAQEAGTITLPATTLQCDVYLSNGRSADDMMGGPFDEFFGRGQRQARTLRTQPIELKVQPLPSPPANFSDLVGDFHLDGQLAQTALKVGESTTLTLTVRGNGNISHITEPVMPMPQGFKVYDDKPTIALNNRGSVLTGDKVFRKALVPTQAGQLTVPAASLTYFDPTLKVFKTATSPTFNVHVSPGEQSDNRAFGGADFNSLPRAKVDVQVLGDDILPIYKRQDAVGTRRFRQFHEVIWGFVFGIPPALFLLAALIHRHRSARAQTSHLRRRGGAAKQALRAVPHIQQSLRSGRLPEAAAQASRSLREYLGDALNLEGLALTPPEARVHLQTRGIAVTLASEVETWLNRCEAAQYGAAGGVAFGNLANELRALVVRVDRALRRR